MNAVQMLSFNSYSCPDTGLEQTAQISEARMLMKTLTSRQRFQTTLKHQQPDRVCVDFGGTWISGFHASIVHKLRQRLIGPSAEPVRVHEPYQMLAEVDAELRTALDLDIVGVWPRKNIFGYEPLQTS
jgi:hypothetical protein